MKKPNANAPRERPSSIDTSGGDHLISTKQACELLGGCSKMHLWRLLHDESYRSLGFPEPIERGKHGRHPRKYFWRGEVLAWLAKQKVSLRPKAA